MNLLPARRFDEPVKSWTLFWWRFWLCPGRCCHDDAVRRGWI